MTARQKNTPAYSLPEAQRHAVCLHCTVPRELVERVKRAAGTRRGNLSRYVTRALEAALRAQVDGTEVT